MIAGRRSECTAELQRPKARKIKEKGSDKPEKRSRQKRSPSLESSTVQTPVAEIKMERLDQDDQGINNSIGSEKFPKAKIKIEKTETIKPLKKEPKADSSVVLMPGKNSAYYDRAQYPKMQGLADTQIKSPSWRQSPKAKEILQTTYSMTKIR